MRRSLIAVAIAILLIAAKTRSVRSPSPPKPLSGTRSFEITDKAIVAPFTLDRVLAQLIARSGVSGLTPQQLMRQMYDTQNPKPGMADPAGPHCDDTVIGGIPAFNGFPRRCPTPEGQLAATPYADGEFHTRNVVLFVEQVSKATGGQLDIKVHSNGSLIKHPELMRAVSTGQVNIGEFLLGQFANEEPVFAVDNLPFLAAGYDNAEKLYRAQKAVLEKKLAAMGRDRASRGS